MTMSRERPHRGNWTCMVFETATSLAKLGFILTVFLQGVILGQHLRNTARSARGANRSTSKLWLQTFPWEKRLIPNRIAWHTLWMQGSIFIAAIRTSRPWKGAAVLKYCILWLSRRRHGLRWKSLGLFSQISRSSSFVPDFQQFSASLAWGNSHPYLIWLWWRASLAWPSPNARSHHKDRFVYRADGYPIERSPELIPRFPEILMTVTNGSHMLCPPTFHGPLFRPTHHGCTLYILD